MATDGNERAGALVVRAWVEASFDPPERLRARITSSLDLASHDETVRVVASRVEILDAVGDWLDRLLTN